MPDNVIPIDTAKEKLLQQSEKQERLWYPDLLRVLAIFAVVMVHVILIKWNTVPVRSVNWQIYNLYLCLIRWGVPIFVMLSGMFILDPQKNISVKKIYTKYIVRILKALLIWGLFYAVFVGIMDNGTFQITYLSDGIVRIFSGRARYHLWFLYMIIGLYMIAPILRIFTAKAKQKDYWYFFGLAFLFTALIPWLRDYPDSMLGGFVSKLQVEMVTGYVGLFVAGYYLRTFPLSPGARKIIYGLGCLGMTVTILGTILFSFANNTADPFFFSHFSANMILTSVAIFLFTKEVLSKVRFSVRIKRGIFLVADLSFSIYLCHDIFLVLYKNAGTPFLSAFPLITVPLAGLVVFAASVLLAYLLKKLAVWGRKFLPKSGV